jgi:hypothetical protein
MQVLTLEEPASALVIIITPIRAAKEEKARLKTTVRPTLSRGQKISDHGFLKQVDKDNKFAEGNLGLPRLSACTITSQNRERHAAPRLPANTVPSSPRSFLSPVSTIVAWSASAQERPALRTKWHRCRKGLEKAKQEAFFPAQHQHGTPSCLDEAVLDATHHHMATPFLPLLAYPAALRGSSQATEPGLLRPPRS